MDTVSPDAQPNHLNIATPLSKRKRYAQLALIVMAAGAIYPLLYLRQYYYTTMLSYFGITDIQLGQLYSMLGTVLVICYIPGGWLADRISPRILISFSLLAVGSLGFIYATAPKLWVLQLIFIGWGLATGLTFWAAVIKRVSTLAEPEERGRFFGFLDGGRGLIEASLALIAVSLFSWYVHHKSEAIGFRNVLHLYSTVCVMLGAIMVMIRDPIKGRDRPLKHASQKSNVLSDLLILARLPNLWFLALVICCGYQLFWSTYNFVPYLRTSDYGLGAATAAAIGVGKMWTRPIGGIGGGYLADKFSRERILCGVLLGGSLGLCALIFVPAGISHWILLCLVLLTGMLAYTVRSLYWALLDKCGIPAHCTGLAIGLVSMIGYSGDIFLPLISGYLTQNFPGATGFRYFFGYVALIAVIGAFGAWKLHYRFKEKNKETNK